MSVFRRILFCLLLAMSSLSLCACPQQVELTMQRMKQQNIAHTLPDEDFNGDGDWPPPGEVWPIR